jgi:DNA-binding IclR family transcriptional regulator
MGASGIQVLHRAADILRLCAARKQGLSLGQIATALKLPRSTVQRIVSTLMNEGLLRSDGSRGSIRLGAALYALANTQRIDVVEIAHPYLKILSERTGETVDLALYKGDHLVFVDQVAGSHRLRAVSSVGEVFPMANTANGRAALALLAGEEPQAEDNEEHTTGICALGTAFKVDSGEIYAISVPMPSVRFAESREVLMEQLLTCRVEIEEACRLA